MNKYHFYFCYILLCLCIVHSPGQAQAEQVQTVRITDAGYKLWLNYKPIQDNRLKQSYIRYYKQVNLPHCKYDDIIAEEYFNDIKQCPELYLLCFHYVPWNHRMKSGDTLEKELSNNLQQGIKQVEENIQLWKSIHSQIDSKRFEEVMKSLLKEQQDARVFYESATEFFSSYLPHNPE